MRLKEIKNIHGLRWVILIFGIGSFVMGVVGLITGEAVEPSHRFRTGMVQSIDGDEAAFTAVMMWRFGIAILCFLFFWLFRERKNELY